MYFSAAGIVDDHAIAVEYYHLFFVLSFICLQSECAKSICDILQP